MLTEIQRGHFGGGKKMPSDIIRLQKSTIAVSENISEQFQAERIHPSEKNPDYESVMLGLAIDKDAKQIQLVRNSINGFAFGVRGKYSKNLIVGSPSGLKKADMPIGDYLVSDRDHLVFTLAE